MKNFFNEFKKFITRGNVIDMSVGVIVGSAFTAIVNGLSNFVLKPVINWILALIFGKDSFADIHTFLIKVEKTVETLNDAGEVVKVETVPDLTQSIYIDWGSFINAIINFFIIAFVLFTIVKIINKLRADQKELEAKVKGGRLTKEQKKELKANGIKARDKAAAEAYFAEKARLEAEAAAKAEAEAAEKARIERENNPTTEDLLKLILARLNEMGAQG